ncbi:MAG: exodeoxyribonuclease III [Archaeoglobaceae archaeon]|nr:exodeoxyribonuclease III [Archaeoglobaceae archaeon]MDW7990289.1 exodeoxyribonuclease III [Archaeoglobaceae archaeon]
MKVATFNVNSIKSRLHIVIPWLKENKTDFLCLQETKVENRKFPSSYFHRIGYKVVFQGKGGQSGVAIASIREPDETSFGLDGEDEDRLIFTRFGDLKLINVYVPQGHKIDSEKFVYKLKWLEKFHEWLKSFDLKEKIIICGDMNVAPEAIDVHSPEKLKNHVCFHEDARKAYKKILEIGFVDLLRKMHPNERIYSFYDYRVKGAMEKGLGWRVDAIIASPRIAEKCVRCDVDVKPRLSERPSDHLPIIAEFLD